MVTKGDFPQLVRNNILKNKQTCEESGLEHYTFEVVTDKSISLVTNENVRELVVPGDYATKSGALYKSRALQYCLEKDVSYIFKKRGENKFLKYCLHFVILGQQFE